MTALQRLTSPLLTASSTVFVSKLVRVVVVLLVAGVLGHSQCWQNTKDQLGTDTSTMWQALRHAQRAMLTPQNLAWELPVGAATGVLIAAGDTPVARQVSGAHNLNSRSNTASTAMTDLMIGSAGALYMAGCATGHDHALRAGISSLAATGFAVVFSEAVKYSFRRERPFLDDGRGEFWEGGNSFPSGHTIAAWAAASALAHSYPHNRWVKWTAYGAATAVGALRITAHQHFPSDVVIGGTLGYTIGNQLGRP
jgi:membrane-associated phospholipid phosphatase